VPGQAGQIRQGFGLQDPGLEFAQVGEALALGGGLGVESGAGLGDAEHLGPALLGGIEIAARLQQAGMLDVGGHEAGLGLVNLVEEAKGAGIVGELGGGGGFGQPPLGLFDARIGRGNHGQGSEEGIGVGRGEIGHLEHLEGFAGGRRPGVGGTGGAGEGDNGGGRGGPGGAVGCGRLFGGAGGADFLGAGEIGGLGFREDDMPGPIHQEDQQGHLEEEDGRGQQPGGGLEQAGAGAEAGMGGDDVLELEPGLAQDELIVVGQMEFLHNGGAVAFEVSAGVQRGQVHAIAALFEPGVTGGDLVVVGQQQMAVCLAADQGNGLADHEALACVASG
jgi:hypothetical protein